MIDADKPDYVSAPYEESGIGTISMLFQSISALMTRCDAVTVTLRRSNKHPALVEFTVSQLASTTPQVKVDATPLQA